MKKRYLIIPLFIGIIGTGCQLGTQVYDTNATDSNISQVKQLPNKAKDDFQKILESAPSMDINNTPVAQAMTSFERFSYESNMLGFELLNASFSARQMSFANKEKDKKYLIHMNNIVNSLQNVSDILNNYSHKYANYLEQFSQNENLYQNAYQNIRKCINNNLPDSPIMNNIKSMMINMPQDAINGLYNSMKDMSNIKFDLINKNLKEAKNKLK